MPSQQKVDAAKHVANEEYKVGNTDMVVNEINLRLLPDGATLHNMESAMTSVSQKPAGGSLTTVLQQALQSDDQEQLDWILAQREISLVTSTIRSLNVEYVGRLLTQILNRFQ